tara:strand:- start:211 stop:765 length:555 start_codon:yes stop_codon:yes gene_type:complete
MSKINYDLPNKSKHWGVTDLPNAYFSENNNSKKLRKNVDNFYINESNNNNSNVDEVKIKFLSDENIYNVNKILIEKLLKFYNIKLPLQKKMTVYKYCYSVWKNNSLNNSTNINKQVLRLNHIVIKLMIPEILTSIKQKIKYLEDLKKPYPLMNRPLNSSSYEPNKSVSNIIHYNKDDVKFDFEY